MRLPLLCFNPASRGRAMIRNARIQSKGRGDNTNNGKFPIKDLSTKSQHTVPLTRAVEDIVSRIRAS